jgi:hypothetical protein
MELVAGSRRNQRLMIASLDAVICMELWKARSTRVYFAAPGDRLNGHVATNYSTMSPYHEWKVEPCLYKRATS